MCKPLNINDIPNCKILAILRTKVGGLDWHSREVASDFLTMRKVTNCK